jgi:Spy/CpxP family protein refolding chaperone
MSMRLRFAFVRSVALVLALGAPSLALPQVASAQPAAGKAQKPVPAGKRARVLEKIRAVRAARIIQALDLDEASATRLFAVLDRYDDRILVLKREIARLRGQLRGLLDAGKLDEAAAKSTLDRMLAARAEIAKIESERAVEVRKVLSVRQFAQLVLVLPEIERDLEMRIRNVLDRRGGGGSRAGAGGDFE